MPLQLLFFIFPCLLQVTTSKGDIPQYGNCSLPLSFHCGPVSLNISYPFLAEGRPDYCGHPGYRIACSAGKPTLQFNNGGVFLVKEINYRDAILSLAELDSTKGDACPRNLRNTSLDASLFNFTSDDEVLWLFSCEKPVSPNVNDGIRKLGCSSNETSLDWYYSLGVEELSAAMVGLCSPPIGVQLHRSAVEGLKKGGGWGDVLYEGFVVGWKAGIGWCSDCVRTGGACGYNSTDPSSRTCFCRCGAGPGPCGSGSNGRKGRWKRRLLIACGASLGGFLLSIIVLLLCTRRSCFDFLENKHEKSKTSVEDFLDCQGPLALTRYSYRQVKRMTNSFRTKLGHGGYGSVFKGHLTNNNSVLIPVAVKLLSDSKGSGEDFINEVASIGRTNHVNIVSLLGFCSQGSKRALVYEFMPNGSLEKYLFSSNHNTATPLGWDKLYNIALGIAKGLEYLHKGCRTRIVHFDIKPHNILLDKDFCPKISDFGLAKFSRTNESILSMDCARGTIGYIAPEVYSRSFGVVSSKSDVYSYGMMVLEMVGGRKNFDGRLEKSSEKYFPHWIYEHLDQNANLVDGEMAPERADVVKKMAMVGLWCIQTNPSCRPSISRAVEMLEGRAEDMEMPPKPYICSPERSMPNTNCSYNTSMSASLFQQN